MWREINDQNSVSNGLKLRQVSLLTTSLIIILVGFVWTLSPWYFTHEWPWFQPVVSSIFLKEGDYQLFGESHPLVYNIKFVAWSDSLNAKYIIIFLQIIGIYFCIHFYQTCLQLTKFCKLWQNVQDVGDARQIWHLTLPNIFLTTSLFLTKRPASIFVIKNNVHLRLKHYLFL